MSRPAPGVLHVTSGSKSGSRNIGANSRMSEAIDAWPSSENRAPCRAADCAAATNWSNDSRSTNLRAVRLLYGPLLIQNSFVYLVIETTRVCNDLFEDIAHPEVVAIALVEVDVASRKRGPIQMPHQNPFLRRELFETICVQLDDGCVVDLLEAVPALSDGMRGKGRMRHSFALKAGLLPVRHAAARARASRRWIRSVASTRPAPAVRREPDTSSPVES